jgi:CubicO group peptidase (beta-lactamase class C family)
MHFPGPRKDAHRAASRRTFLAGIAAFAGVARARGAETDALDGIVASFDAMCKSHGVPSISVALVEGGHVALAQRGVRSVASGEAVGPQTRYQAASMSKTIAALTALRLAQDGRVSLDQDVAHYLKRWPLPALPSGASRPVTLRRLFGMTAGCNVPGYFGYAAGAALPDDVQILQGASPANSPLVRIVQAPGSARASSGGGCQIGQVVLEDATGQSFGALVEELVLKPLDMTRSAFWQPPAASDAAMLAVAHDRNGREVAGHFHVYPELAAAGLWSTPSDLAQLIVVMAKAAKGDKTTPFGDRALADMLTSVDDLGYGLGVALAGSARDRVAMKRGNNLGFRGGLVACPRSGQGAVVMTNGDGGEVVVDAVLDTLARRYKWPAGAPWPE